MGISGCLVARCTECKCRWNWSMDNFPFADAEIVGTCSNCMDRIDHDCVDEMILGENYEFKKVGRKEF